MYKRPSLRVRDPWLKTQNNNKAPEGSFIHKLLNPPPTVNFKQIKRPVYQKDAYLVLLKKNHEERGIEWVEPEIPDYEAPQVVEKIREPHIEYSDQVRVNLRYLKNGIIRVKLDTSFPTLYEKYYNKQKLPPMKSIIQAYKSLGFSKDFLDCIKQNFDRKADTQKRISTLIDNVFNKEPTKKTKKKKKEEELVDEEADEEQEEPDEDDDVGDDDDPGEDGEMDVEVDNDDEIEEQQEDEEAYISD